MLEYVDEQAISDPVRVVVEVIMNYLIKVLLLLADADAAVDHLYSEITKKARGSGTSVPFRWMLLLSSLLFCPPGGSGIPKCSVRVV